MSDDAMTPAKKQWAHQVEMVRRDNELRHRTPEQWREDAQKRLEDLERRAAEWKQGTALE